MLPGLRRAAAHASSGEGAGRRTSGRGAKARAQINGSASNRHEDPPGMVSDRLGKGFCPVNHVAGGVEFSKQFGFPSAAIVHFRIADTDEVRGHLDIALL
jgi:hypothetical protein